MQILLNVKLYFFKIYFLTLECGCPHLGQQSAVLAWAEPATSLLVKTNGGQALKFGTEDKLRMLFTIKKRGGSPVQYVKNWNSSNGTDNSLDQYEVRFKNGWGETIIFNGFYFFNQHLCHVIVIRCYALQHDSLSFSLLFQDLVVCMYF